MKLHDNKPNRVLIDISGQLVYDNDKIEKIKKEITGVDEVFQDEIVDMALYMSNYYLNEREVNQNTSPLQDQRDFIYEQGDELIRAYYQNNLPPITFKEDFSGEYLTVGDVRMSQYDDTIPIVSYREDGYVQTLDSPEKIYIDVEDIDMKVNRAMMNCDIEPKENYVQAIVF